jgi:glycosyltransferase involved in cell wall biosynthesis
MTTKGESSPDMNCSISVIIPCYSCSDSIERAIASIIQQSLLPKELLLIDDASADGGATLDKLQLLKQKYNTYLDILIISLDSNVGPSGARNVGWEHASGKYIAFLDSDDSWHPEKIRLQYSWMISHPLVALCGHPCEILYGAAPKPLPEQWSVDELKKGQVLLKNPFSTPSVMIRRDIPFRFCDGQYYAEDYFLWQQIICAKYPVAIINLPLAYLYKSFYGESGLSSHIGKMGLADALNYWRLYNSKYINIFTALSLMVYSGLKYLRRVLILSMDKL